MVLLRGKGKLSTWKCNQILLNRNVLYPRLLLYYGVIDISDYYREIAVRSDFHGKIALRHIVGTELYCKWRIILYIYYYIQFSCGIWKRIFGHINHIPLFWKYSPSSWYVSEGVSSKNNICITFHFNTTSPGDKWKNDKTKRKRKEERSNRPQH